MKVYFGCSTNNILKHKEAYTEALKTIKGKKHELTRDWVRKSIDLAESKTKDIPSATLYQEVMSAIAAADVAIFDITETSMTIGHQLTFAMSKSKPILLLGNYKNSEEMEGMFIGGARSPLVMIKNYQSVDEIERLVNDFLVKYARKPNTRFNLVLDRELATYVDWATFNYKSSKTDVIKDSIRERLEKDGMYQDYLQRFQK